MASCRRLLTKMNSVRIAFYTEAGMTRGMGHLVRSYCIASKFKQLGFDVTFFLDSDTNFDDKFDGITYFNWQNLSINVGYDIILIDSYEANIENYQLIAASCKTPVYIDDYERLHYPTGTIINFSPNANDSFYKHKNIHSNYLLGLKYIPIRDEFLTIQPIKQKQIFIMLGGADVANLSYELIIALNDISIKKVIVCNNEKNANALQKLNNVCVLYKPLNSELIQAMANSCLAISTASMTTYELAFLKIPAVIIAVSKNQEIGMPQLIKHHIAQCFVSITEESWKRDLKYKVKTLLHKAESNINNQIDGNGTNNIVSAVLELTK